MRPTMDIWSRATAIVLLLVAVTACSTPGDGNGDVGGDASPAVSITAPSPGATFASGASITFTGSANDAEDGDLTVSLTWSSDLDGSIGTGGDLTSTLDDGTHVVEASVTDSVGQSASASVTITVGDGEGGGGTTGTRDVGFVAVEELDDDALGTVAVTASGGFVRFDADIPDAFFDDPWDQLVGSCEVTDTIGDVDPFDDLPLPDGLGMTFLEAGDPVEVTAVGGPYLELDRMETMFGGDTFVAYATTDDVAGPLAASLAADIPGDEFPAVANAAFPEVGAFTLTAPADPEAVGAVDVETTFEWTGASGAANTIVTIDLVSSDLSTYVTCYAADTGSFTLPDTTKTELGAAFSGRVGDAGRESIRVETVGDARLLLSVSRAQTFTPPILLPPSFASRR